MTCRKCGSTGPFYEKHSAGICKECCRRNTRDWMKRNPGYVRRWRAANPDKYRGYALGRYGLTGEDYEALSANQDGRCAICVQVPEDHRLYVDHCHAGGKVRGLLCRPCNSGLGSFRDDPALMRQAISYLDLPPAQGHLALGLAA